MSDSQESTPPNSKKSDPLNLNSLMELSLGPRWSTAGQTPHSPHSPKQRSPQRFEDKEYRKKPQPKHKTSEEKPVFVPSVAVAFYPENDSFSALLKALKSSFKTYELFEIARLLLEKPERFTAVIHPKSEAETAALYSTALKNIPFETEAEALDFSARELANQLFEIEAIELPEPTGSFPFINKCGVTGKLLGPPNYHRYPEILKEHHAKEVADLPFEAFCKKIVKAEGEEALAEWKAHMRKGSRYTLKLEALTAASSTEADPSAVNEPQATLTQFNSWEEARAYLLHNHKKKLVRTQKSVKIHGIAIQELPEGAIKSSILHQLEQQRKFPLDTANNLRGRLRHSKFEIYKDKRGFVCVCAKKPRVLENESSLANSVLALLSFIKQAPNPQVKTLALEYLKLPAPETPKEGIASTSTLTTEEQAAMRQVMLDLRWLVSEGYVTEYGNGSLSIPFNA